MRKKKLSAKSAGPQVRRETGTRWLDCKECGVDGAYCALDVKAVTCSLCVAKQAAPPETPKHLQVKTDDEERPRGWHLKKEYISPSGKVYHKGKEVDESVRHAIRPAKPAKERAVNADKASSRRPRGRPKSKPAAKRGRKRKAS